jgi:inner membrane protein
MHIPTHILSGWCVAGLLPFSPRERLFCMLAASLHDLDGLGFFLGEEAYWRFHHILGHNIFFGILMCAALAAFSTRRVLALGIYLALFHLHLLMDYFGSGPGWRIHYFWPVDPRGIKTDLAWPLTSWQNYLAFALLLAGTVMIARVRRITPLELIAPRLDARLNARLLGQTLPPP